MIGYRDRLNESTVLINTYNSLKRMIENPRQINKFWPSEMTYDITRKDGTIETVGECGRKIFYKIYGELQEPINYLSLKRMALGNLVEANEITYGGYISNDNRGGLKFQFKEGDIIISGKIDHVIKDIITDKYLIIEHKSSYGHFFVKEIFKEGKFKPNHAMQLGLYMYGIRVHDILNNKDTYISTDTGSTDFIPNESISSGLLVYTDRGNCDNTEFMIDTYPVNPVKLENTNIENDPHIATLDKSGHISKIANLRLIFQKLHSIYYDALEHRLHPRDYVPSTAIEILNEHYNNNRISKADKYAYTTGKKKIDWQCSYCPYQKMCIENKLPNTLDKNIQIAKNRLEEVHKKYLDLYKIDLNKMDKEDAD